MPLGRGGGVGGSTVNVYVSGVVAGSSMDVARQLAAIIRSGKQQGLAF